MEHLTVSALDLTGSWEEWRTCIAGGAITMITTTATTTHATVPETSGTARGFEDSELLRSLLIRLHEAGQWAWRADPEVGALMHHTADRYAALARRHGLDPWEAAAAAFDAMRTGSVRRADDPWAVITRAVKVTCIAEERANGLLCSVHQARRPKYSSHHDAERFSDRENPLTDYHPRFHSHDTLTLNTSTEASDDEVRVAEAVEDTVLLFLLLGWPEDSARTALDYICTRLSASGSRASAFESLRRDYQARGLLDLPTDSWMLMLRLVLGNPDPMKSYTNAARGVLFRVLSGEPLHALLADTALVAEVVRSVPPMIGGHHGG